MKKIISLILITTLLTISLCACGNTETQKDIAKETTSQEETIKDIEVKTDGTVQLENENEEEYTNTENTEKQETEENKPKIFGDLTEEQKENIETLIENTENQTESDLILNETETIDNLYEEKVLFKIEMMNGDIMEGELYPNLAPVTVNNFINLVNNKFYDGLIFHRVIPGFMIQGGGFNESFEQKATSEIKGEFTSNGFKNELSHTKGVISMARTVIPDSATSQFFIIHEDSQFLDGQYAAFGKITSGLEIIDKIANTKTEAISDSFEDVPIEPQIIKTITIVQ